MVSSQSIKVKLSESALKKIKKYVIYKGVSKDDAINELICNSNIDEERHYFYENNPFLN
jgi:predicted DNA binding CopG/RHH family protein